MYRGYALFTLATGMGFCPAAILLSSLFGAVHLSNSGEDWIGALSVVLFALFACFYAVANGEFVVRDWVARGRRLRRDVYLFGSGQRHGGDRPSLEFQPSWTPMADGRHGGAGRKRVGFRLHAVCTRDFRVALSCEENRTSSNFVRVMSESVRNNLPQVCQNLDTCTYKTSVSGSR